MEVNDYAIVLAQFESPYYYGNSIEIVLPMQYDAGVSEYKVLVDKEAYSPLPYVVAEYKLSYSDTTRFFYDFCGVKIINND